MKPRLQVHVGLTRCHAGVFTRSHDTSRYLSPNMEKVSLFGPKRCLLLLICLAEAQPRPSPNPCPQPMFGPHGASLGTPLVVCFHVSCINRGSHRRKDKQKHSDTDRMAFLFRASLCAVQQYNMYCSQQISSTCFSYPRFFSPQTNYPYTLLDSTFRTHQYTILDLTPPAYCCRQKTGCVFLLGSISSGP